MRSCGIDSKSLVANKDTHLEQEWIFAYPLDWFNEEGRQFGFRVDHVGQGLNMDSSGGFVFVGVSADAGSYHQILLFSLKKFRCAIEIGTIRFIDFKSFLL
jgi:hypothetical protein